MWPFKSNPIEPLPSRPISLADEATSALGFHDAMRATTIDTLRNYREELAANIAAETNALAVIDEQLAREELAFGKADLDVVKVEAETLGLEGEPVDVPYPAVAKPKRAPKLVEQVA